MHSTLLVLALISQPPSLPSNPAKTYSPFVEKVQALAEKKDRSGLNAIRLSAKDPFQQIVFYAYALSVGDSTAKEPFLNSLAADPKWLQLVPATEGNGVGLVWPTVWRVAVRLAKQGDPRAIRGMFALSNVADGASAEGMSGDIGEFLSQHSQLVVQNWSAIREFREALSGGYEFGITPSFLPKLRKEYSKAFSSQPKYREEMLKLLSGPRG